jgi:hypothetical protein
MLQSMLAKGGAMAKKVFLSCGRCFTPQQEAFVRSFEDYLRTEELEPKTVGRTAFSSEAPLKPIRNLIAESQGAIVLAFERTHIAQGADKRGSKDSTPLSDVPVTTVWNQIEGAMAYCHDLPIMMLAQKGLKSEGLVEKGYDWFVQWIDLDQAVFASSEFRGVFQDWKRRVVEFEPKTAKAAPTQKSGDVADTTIGDLLRRLTLPQIWAAGSAIFVAVAAIATTAFTLGGTFGK